jgi:hypothetical protein
MAKFSGFQKYLLEEGLKAYAAEMKADIVAMEGEGKRPIMTTGYVDMIVKDTLDQLVGFTIKEKKSR